MPRDLEDQPDAKTLADALDTYEAIFADPRLVVTNIYQHSNYHLNTDNIQLSLLLEENVNNNSIILSFF